MCWLFREADFLPQAERQTVRNSTIYQVQAQKTRAHRRQQSMHRNTVPKIVSEADAAFGRAHQACSGVVDVCQEQGVEGVQSSLPQMPQRTPRQRRPCLHRHSKPLDHMSPVRDNPEDVQEAAVQTGYARLASIAGYATRPAQ